MNDFREPSASTAAAGHRAPLSPAQVPATSTNTRAWWKVLPGIAVSAFFLWRALRSLRYPEVRALHCAPRQGMAGRLLFLFASYGLRVYRWWFMLRRSGAPSVGVCARVLLTSFAANNVLPFRIGDFLRIFSYAGDLGASSSTILSTVILERLLDIFTLLAFLVALLVGAGQTLPPFVLKGHAFDLLHVASPVLAACALGLMVLLFGASLLQRIVQGVVARFKAGPRTARLERWALLLFDAVLNLSFAGRLLLLASSVVIWLCEGMIFLSAAHLLDVVVRPRGPWLALSLSNLSFLLPSSPGAIGTYEFASQFSMVSQGAQPTISALYGLLVHLVGFFSVTAVGGAAFFLHRLRRKQPVPPLTEELAELPLRLPAA